MGLFALMVFASGFAALVAGLIVRTLTRHSRNRAAYGVIGFFVTGIVVFGIFVFSAQSIIDNSTKIGFGVSTEEANRDLLSFKLPPEATDVNYRNNIWLGTLDVADFTIDEKSFLAWAKKNGWHMKRFITTEREDELQNESLDDSIPSTLLSSPESVYPTKCFVEEDHDLVDIYNGYHANTYKEENPDFGESITYDLDNSRAYIISTTR